MQGTKAALARVGQFARRDVPRCSLSERIGVVQDRVQTAGWNVCVVVNDENIVLGLLREREMSADPERTAGHAMRSGPATYRPNALVTEVAERLEQRGVPGILVTLPNGTLVGWLRRDDAARAVTENEGEAAGKRTG
jgi:CBS domain-containing protein